eukprot:TRINITY_DN346_c0_g1_i2.p1 TRINITY_DN346_c0_g1~~TRINITY_DN346_c0_g1_i2.p1  ORF type:complete len:235 (-),score=44.36 TRINITY_DN346_c0_g1_i2:21-674(-)
MAESAGLDLDKIMEAVVKATDETRIELNHQMKVGLIMIVSRNYGYEKSLKTVELAKRWRNHIVGFDFAAGEIDPPVETFVNTVKLVHELKIPLTVHIGEGSNRENIRKVLDLYGDVKRLGHATCLDEELTKRCIQRDILVESCPTSNFITYCVPSYKEHPLLLWKAHGLPFNINTDDPTLFDVDLNDEWTYCLKELGLTKDDMLKINEESRKYSFIK